ncbi:LEM-3-like GIY-YIG domain-containing protein [Roseobacter sp. S98]|uniref:LEM-3-like GIY-YIG domain-containing protein n=1 Tax=Roseobacter algicola (ex Choi et al. 2025) (nom. illeg.) TaxID=3092138 RepID=UPI0035C7357C
MPFNAMVSAKLAAYVYALADPRKEGALKDRIFYIGKGNGNRCFSHARNEADGASLNEGEHRLARIREIRSAGKDVEVLIVSHGLTDPDAHSLETALIPLLGDTNKVAGHGDRGFWLTENQVKEIHDRPIERGDIDLIRGNLLFVSLNQQDTTMLLNGVDDEVAQATLGNWNLNERDSRRVDCIVGVKNSLVLSVFETEKTPHNITRFDRLPAPKKGAHGRSRFFGTRRSDLEEQLRGRTVCEEGQVLSKIRPAAACQFFPAMQ